MTAATSTNYTPENHGRRIRENLTVFKARREKVLAALNGTPLMVVSHPEFIRNDDVEHSYRPDSNLYYLTGFEEPESIFLMLPGRNPQTVLFVRRKNIERETWDGFRFGVEGAKNEFGVDAVYAIDEFHTHATTLLKDFNEIYYRMYKNEWADQIFKKMMKDYVTNYSRKRSGLLVVKDADVLLGEFRLRKDSYDMQNLRKACEISARGHLLAMKMTQPGMNEKQIEGLLISEFYRHGALREGYGAIVASGNSSTTLHYRFNDQTCKEGDLLLIDAGAEYNFYTGDITRTFPVNGRFTAAQKRVYDQVLKVQKKVIEAIKPGVLFQDLQMMGVNILTEAMFELGLLTGRKEDVIESLEYKKYYPHGIGHWLGMDVHDAGQYMINGKPIALEPGMCFTVEPGLYIPATDKSAPADLRGIGVRIEDNVLVTDKGCEVLTSLVPKEVEEIEQIMTRSALAGTITL